MMLDAIFFIIHVSLLLNIGMIIMVVRKCKISQTRTAFLSMIGIMTFWNIGTILEMDFRIATGVTYLAFINICYIGICLVPVAVLYLGRTVMQPDWHPQPVNALILIIPVISIVMVFTNQLHGLFFADFSLYSSEAVYGAYYYFHSVYSYGCIIIGVGMLFVASLRNSGVFSMQSLLVIAGVLTTVVPNMLYSFGVGNLPFSISTAAFTVTSLCFTVAFLKYRFINTLPITLRQVVDLISDGYFVLDSRLCIQAYNQALLHLFPGPVTIELGTDFHTFADRHFSGDFYSQFTELQTRAVAERQTAAEEMQISGRTIYIKTEVTPVMNRGAHIGSIVLLKDITQSKLLIEATQAATRAKSDFLSHMSHEIRTPLNAIIGMINIGMNTDDINKKNYCLDNASGASRHLLGIINDILDISKIEADKFELSYGEIDFEKMLMAIANVTNVRAEAKRQNFIVNIGENVPAFIESDELRLSQVITNLLTNAIKFTPEKGAVILNIENLGEISEDGDDGPVTLRVEVADTGIGISKEQQKKLFTSFNQADASITKKYGGTGLGLAISKRIVELLGGKIWIESELGQGANFIFTMKAIKVQKAQSPRARLFGGVNAADIRILAADGFAETREYFKKAAAALDIYCDTAADGAEALEMIGKSIYNIFFIDWQLPGTDDSGGVIELIKKIKAGGDNSVVLMIAVSDRNSAEKEAEAAGVRHFISKPLFPSTFIEAVNICAGKETQKPESAPQAGHSVSNYDFSGYTLLIAEDVEINREIMNAILEGSGAAVDYAENGKIAVAMFEENPGKYNLILMDVNMPEMNGHEATRQIRALGSPESRDIPIIAMTANVFREDIDKCIESGMNGHTGKPIDAGALFALLGKWLGTGV